MQMINTPSPFFADGDGATTRRSSGAFAASLLDQIDHGLALVSQNCRLVYANRAARQEFERGETLAITGDLLRCPSSSSAEFALALTGAIVNQRTRLLMVGAPSTGLPIVVAPFRTDGDAAPSALIMIGRRALCSPLGLELLAIHHALTLTERRVLRALAADRSTREIATVHGVAMSTLRTQIQSIRGKVGVRSMDALLLRTAQVPPVNSRVESARL